MADLIVQKNEAITTLLFNRPDARNALSLEMRSLLRDSLMDAENDETVRCVVLKGAGGHFMAGGDVKSMKDTLDQNPKDTKNYFLNRIHDLHPIMFAMRRMAKPVIASVEGAAARNDDGVVSDPRGDQRAEPRREQQARLQADRRPRGRDARSL